MTIKEFFKNSDIDIDYNPLKVFICLKDWANEPEGSLVVETSNCDNLLKLYGEEVFKKWTAFSEDDVLSIGFVI